MPLKVVKQGGKYRLKEPSGKIAKTPGGKARDGGGHATPGKAHAQKYFIEKGKKG